MVARHRRGFRIPRSPCRSPDDGETCGCAARQLDTPRSASGINFRCSRGSVAKRDWSSETPMQPGGIGILDSRKIVARIQGLGLKFSGSEGSYPRNRIRHPSTPESYILTACLHSCAARRQTAPGLVLGANLTTKNHNRSGRNGEDCIPRCRHSFVFSRAIGFGISFGAVNDRLSHALRV